MNSYVLSFTLLWCMLMNMTLYGQEPAIDAEPYPTLPDNEGFAGMFGGVSNGYLFGMGGANFPAGKPWEGGAKAWYNSIYKLDGKEWVKIPDTLYMPIAYGVSVSYQDRIIIVGGNNAAGYSNKVVGYQWEEGKMSSYVYPNLPSPLANMTGSLVGQLIVIAGGCRSDTDEAQKVCYVLDLEDTARGWIDIEPWAGAGRMLAASSTYEGKFYLFGGMNNRINAFGEQYSHILEDGYVLSFSKAQRTWVGCWEKLTPMPKPVAGLGSPLPLVGNGQLVFFGGIDRVLNLNKDPKTFPEIPRDVILYNVEQDTWEYAGSLEGVPARATYPVVFWKESWLILSGEIAPGVRTNSVYAIGERKKKDDE